MHAKKHTEFHAVFPHDRDLLAALGFRFAQPHPISGVRGASVLFFAKFVFEFQSFWFFKPRQYSTKLRDGVMNESMATYHLLAAGSDESRDDYRALSIAERRGEPAPWSALKRLKKNDFVLVYCQAPHSAIVATARALFDADEGVDYRYETELRDVRMLKEPISLAELRKLFPKWVWAKKARGQAYLARDIGQTLWKRAGRKKETGTLEEALAKKIVRGVGAGFGDPEKNKRVEQAAIAYATKYFKREGFKVTSREQDKIGYDLHVTDGKKEFHVEVKGVSGSQVKFPITCGEVNVASRDRAFQLMVVTGAGTASARHRLYKTGQLARLFELRPLAYMAELK